MQKKPGYKIIKEVKGKKSDNSKENKEIGVYIDRMADGTSILSIDTENISIEELAEIKRGIENAIGMDKIKYKFLGGN